MTPNKDRQKAQRERDRAAGIIQCNVKIRRTDRQAFIAMAEQSRAGRLETDSIQTTTEPTADHTAPQEQASNVQTTDAFSLPTAPYRHRYVMVMIPDRGDCQIAIERHARILCQDKPARG